MRVPYTTKYVKQKKKETMTGPRREEKRRKKEVDALELFSFTRRRMLCIGGASAVAVASWYEYIHKYASTSVVPRSHTYAIPFRPRIAIPSFIDKLY